jgi:hypothetical protein
MKQKVSEYKNEKKKKVSKKLVIPLLIVLAIGLVIASDLYYKDIAATADITVTTATGLFTTDVGTLSFTGNVGQQVSVPITITNGDPNNVDHIWMSWVGLPAGTTITATLNGVAYPLTATDDATATVFDIPIGGSANVVLTFSSPNVIASGTSIGHLHIMAVSG